MFWIVFTALLTGFGCGLIFERMRVFWGLTPKERYFLSEFYRQLREGELEIDETDE